MKLTRAITFAAMLSFVFYGTASAATLRTPFMIGSSFVACVVTNTGAKPIEVAVSVTDAAGASLGTFVDDCNGTAIAPQTTCTVQVNTFSAAFPIGGFCTFKGTGKFRAVGYATSGATAVGFAATK